MTHFQMFWVSTLSKLSADQSDLGQHRRDADFFCLLKKSRSFVLAMPMKPPYQMKQENADISRPAYVLEQACGSPGHRSQKI